ncbi:hypothetical protein [Pseudoalteromonas luteoviolacea]|uniref:hypothetical protein n=1 Tax=Pseudoalteromonas luteoviolacea TaxID=43657 RepID=UPI0012DAAA19|nr:hypothetical protein [Pseudoalteromonas luteoviolacea]
MEISQLVDHKGVVLSVFLLPPLLGVIFSIVIVLTARVEIHKEGIFRRGLNKYGFKDLIPWVNILDAEIINFNQGRFLKLRIRYNRNVLSRNGSKAIDTTNIMLSVKLAPYPDDEILKLMKLARYGRR